MKVVCCRNCGAKYQLDDDDNIETFECSSCAGDLEYIEDYSDGDSNPNKPFLDSFKYNDSYMVQCQDCGLKYKIKSTDSILDYECDSCGGSLRYLDEEMNKELDKYVEERKTEIDAIRQNSTNTTDSNEVSNGKPDLSLKSFTNKLENFFSEENMLQIADEERMERELQNNDNHKTARTTIPKSVLSRFGKEFALPKTNDYNIMKNFLKDEFAKGLEEYYPKRIESEEDKGFLDRISIKEPSLEDEPLVFYEEPEEDEEDEKFNIHDLTYNHFIIIVGAIIFIISIAEILTTNSGIGIVALFIGVIGLIYGIYNNRGESKENNKEKEYRKRIIREHLLSLPEEYYVFYNVKIPISSSSINHLVVGPTGIYAILSKKYDPQPAIERDNDTININLPDDNKIEKVALDGIRRFRYTTKQAKFSKDNEIKQKALTLGEDLINFLNCFVEPLVGFVNRDVVVINMPLTDEDLFIDELINQIQNSVIKLNHETIDKCAVLINRYSADCSAEF